MALELNKLTPQVAAMGQALAHRQSDAHDRIAEARTLLRDHALVTPELHAKINAARGQDAWRRGATPIGPSLNERTQPHSAASPATLIATDGSQVYPDRHGIGPYFLVNTGSIVLRQGSGAAPLVNSIPEVFFETADLYDDTGRLRDTEYVNAQRDRREIETLAELAEAERYALGGDISRPIIALTDGPLRPWTSQTDERESRRQRYHYRQQLARLQAARAYPVGYVDRPESGYVLRILELLGLSIAEITREKLRHGLFLYQVDRALFADLQPNERTGIFAPEKARGHAGDETEADEVPIRFFYLNVSQITGAENAIIARIELPAWVAEDATALDLTQHAIYADCQLTGYPYVLARAHELAVVGTVERTELELMVGQFMLRNGLWPESSAKAWQKHLTRGQHR